MRPSAATLSAALHGAVVLAVLFLHPAGLTRPRPRHPEHAVTIWAPAAHRPSAGGGGQREQLRASRGQPPPPTTHRVFVPPMAHILNDDPRLAVQQAVLIAPDIPTVPFERLGSPFGFDGPLSGGLGGPSGIGDHGCCGVGNRDGSSVDFPGIHSAAPRGPTLQPVLLYKAEPEYSEDARKAKVQGVVILVAEVDTAGRLHKIRVAQSLGLGLDEKAVAAAEHWRFRPATAGGRPVPFPVTIEVNFRLL